jgi:hypothetical protein
VRRVCRTHQPRASPWEGGVRSLKSRRGHWHCSATKLELCSREVACAGSVAHTNLGLRLGKVECADTVSVGCAEAEPLKPPLAGPVSQGPRHHVGKSRESGRTIGSVNCARGMTRLEMWSGHIRPGAGDPAART